MLYYSPYQQRAGLSTHAEAQLLIRHEAFPELKPTLDYIGCSKKACLLCEAFLQIAPLRPRIRGRHGGCYPTWGVSPAHLGRLNGRLTHLSKLLKQRILEQLVSRVVSQIPQSTIVLGISSFSGHCSSAFLACQDVPPQLSVLARTFHSGIQAFESQFLCYVWSYSVKVSVSHRGL